MEQIAVVKIMKTSNGEVRRNMMLPKNIWENIVKENPDKDVTWELRKITPVIAKETKIIQPEEVKEVELVAVADVPEVPEPEAEKPKEVKEEKVKRNYNKRSRW